MPVDYQSRPESGFEHPEGLRDLLARLHDAGRGAWRADPEAAALMRHAAQKYATLARKHGLDPWEAASAAFDAMRTPAVRGAADPWAVVTRAVQITCVAEERATGLLCSVHQARRPRYSSFHDAERFSDRETPLYEYDPAFRVDPFADNDEPDKGDAGIDAPRLVGAAVDDTVALLAVLGWPEETARSGVERICSRLSQEASSRASAFEALRRDRNAAAHLGLSPESWTALLRIVLGSSDPALEHTGAGRGLLMRLLCGEPLRGLLADDQLVRAASTSAPEASGRRAA